MTELIDSARKRLIHNNVIISDNVSASTLTSFKIGGPIDIVAMPQSIDELIKCVDIANECGVRNIVVGKGSNLLFSDNGYRGLVIKTEGLRTVEYEKEAKDASVLVAADCGVSLTALALECSKKSLTGLEFAYGIPGSVGGAIYMNAGAYGGEMANVVTKVLCYDVKDRKLITIVDEALKFDYRKSVFTTNPDIICLRATLRLRSGDPDQITSAMNSNRVARKEKQPLEYPSAGSVFKRHHGYFIGKIIDEMGLKGYTIGGAQVSEKHAGFVINAGGATSADVLKLMDYVTDVVLDRKSVV